MTAPSTMSPVELERHIEDCGKRFLEAYARFEDYGLPADRDEAYQFLDLQNRAINARLAGVQAMRHADFERRCHGR